MEGAAGIYTRVIFPDAVSQGDPQLSDLQRAMLDETPDCIKVVSPDGRLLTMNRAGCAALGVPRDSPFGMPWLPLLPQDVHAPGWRPCTRPPPARPRVSRAKACLPVAPSIGTICSPR
jgi:PAS domain-containing protein